MSTWSSIDAFFENVENQQDELSVDNDDQDALQFTKRKRKRKKRSNDMNRSAVSVHFVGTASSGIAGVNRAVCMLHPDGGSGVSGRVLFESKGNSTRITARVRGLAPGQHGFHIHELGDLSEGCKTAKGHFNPFSKTHGGPKDAVRHVGDLGNITANAEGVATIEMVDPLVQLNGEQSIIGRSVVVHAGTDDLGKGGFEDSLTTGHAGGRVACGVIGIGNSIPSVGNAKM